MSLHFLLFWIILCCLLHLWARKFKEFVQSHAVNLWEDPTWDPTCLDHRDTELIPSLHLRLHSCRYFYIPAKLADLLCCAIISNHRFGIIKYRFRKVTLVLKNFEESFLGKRFHKSSRNVASLLFNFTKKERERERTRKRRKSGHFHTVLPTVKVLRKRKWNYTLKNTLMVYS